MPSSIAWKNGLSRPLITAATFSLSPPAAPVEPEQPERTTAMAPMETTTLSDRFTVASLRNIFILEDRGHHCVPVDKN
jgi:hypothetical protein